MKRKFLNACIGTLLAAGMIIQPMAQVSAVEIPENPGLETEGQPVDEGEELQEGTELPVADVDETDTVDEDTSIPEEETGAPEEELTEEETAGDELAEETDPTGSEETGEETQISVEEIRLEQDQLELCEGETAVIQAQVLPENASAQGLLYSSDNPEVATVDETGTITCVSEGTANITVTSVENPEISACVAVTGLAMASILTEEYHFVPDSFSANTVADWKFDSDYFKSGTLEGNDLVIGDATGNGNDLILNTERVPDGSNAASFMSFSADSIFGDGETESLQMTPQGTDGSGKKVGAFFETVAEAPMNTDEFREGYTLEVILKVPQQVSAWSSVFGQKGTGKLAGMQGGEPEANGGLNISSSRELQWNPWTTNNDQIHDNPTTWSDADGIQPDKWHHVVIKNDGHSTVMIVDGIQVQRCNTFQDQVGIKTLNVNGQPGWVVGTAYWSGSDVFSEAACGDAIFKGSIQEIRMSRGVIDPSEYLVQEHVVDDRYNIPGNNDPYPDLAGKDNYTIVNIPDPQYQTQYKPEIVDAQTEWIRDNREKLNIAMALCVGDLSQDGTEREFLRADQAFSVLDEAGMPYLITDGNHDGPEFKKYFSGSRYEGDVGYQGTGPSGISSYSIIRAGSYEYLFLSLPWGNEDLAADKEWILNVLDTHRQYPTIVFSHFNQDIDTFVKPYDQVFMTVRGHITDRWVSSFKNNAGHDVIDVVTNYQFDLYGGNGWLSTMEFDESANTISFRCYSPWVEKKMKILNGELENNGILLSDEMQLFPFDKLCNMKKETDNTVVSINFKERFPEGTGVSMEDLNLKAVALKEKIDTAANLLDTANRLQYTQEDIAALETPLETARQLYAQYEAVTSVTQPDVIASLAEQMGASVDEMTAAIAQFQGAAKPVTEISITGGDFAMNVGESKQVTATVKPDNAVTKAVAWASSNEGVATVDNNGNVKALKEGIALISASTTDGSNLTAYALVTVNQPAKGVVISKDKAELKVGDKLQLTAKITEGTNQEIVWVSSDPQVASVDQLGMVTALKAGKTEIAAVAADGQGAGMCRDCDRKGR